MHKHGQWNNIRGETGETDEESEDLTDDLIEIRGQSGRCYTEDQEIPKKGRRRKIEVTKGKRRSRWISDFLGPLSIF